MVLLVLYCKAEFENVASVEFPAGYHYCFDVKDSQSDETREGVFMSADDVVEMENSRGEANFVMKFPDSKKQAARESQSGVNMGELTQMMIKALKARKKASKRNADFIVRQIASEAGDAPLPEPVDFDADADNYDPSDAPDEYHPPDESNKRPRR